MAQPSPAADIAIIGGGIAGLTLALSLAKHGIKSTVYERGRGEQALGGCLSIEPNAVAVYERLGMRDQLESAGVPYSGYGFYLPNGDLKTRIAVSDRLPSVRLERRNLQQLLQRLAQESEYVTLKLQHLLCDIETQGDRVRLTFENGVQIQPDFVIGADGIKSFVRRMFDPDSAALPYLGIIGTGVFTTESNIIFDEGNDKPKETPYFRPAPEGKPGEILGLSHPDAQRPDRVFLFANLHIDAKTAVKAENGDIGLKELWADRPNPIKHILESGDYEQPVVWVVRTVPPGKPWRYGPQGRVILIGDAVHALSPQTGQGAGLSIEDAELLARLFAESGSLDKFIEERQRRVAQVLDIKQRGMKGQSTPEEGKLIVDYDSTKVDLKA